MRAKIEAVAHSTTRRPLRGASSIEMAADAAGRALEQAGASYDSIDVFINVGIYRDANICEPAIAALIQEKMGRLSAGKPVFSFDLANGGCGLVNALQVVDSLVRTGSVQRALIVASDVDPKPKHSIGLDIEPAGVGIVVGAGETEGFEAFFSETFTEHADLYDSHLKWIGPTSLVQKLTSTGTQRIELRREPEFPELAADCVLTSVKRFLADRDLSFDDLDLVIAPARPEGLASRLVEKAGLASDRIVVADGPLAGAHTAGPGLALEAAIQTGRFSQARRALMLSAGAGIHVASALYVR